MPGVTGLALALALAACMLPGGAQASFQVEEASVAVVSPRAGARRFDLALANFGQPRYGALLTGQLVYPTADGAYGYKGDCSPVGCNFGCTPFSGAAPPLSLKPQPGQQYIMLLDRGPRDAAGLPQPCYFASKARNAQAAGADALLVVNDNAGDLSTAVAPHDEAGSVAEITISAGLISQADGEYLKSLLRRGPVTVALNWTDVLPQARKVHFEFWTNSGDECGSVCDSQRAFIRKFKSAGRQLQIRGLVDFQPHYMIWVCQQPELKEECASQCIRNGRYCVPDPDNNIREGYTGADVLKMNLRSLCFARAARDRGEPWLWWEFADRLGEDCGMREQKYTEACAQKAFDAVAGANVGGPEGRAAWQACLDIGADGADAPIPLLDAELKAQTGDESGRGTVAILPTVRIQGRQYRGSLEAGSVLRAVCAAFPGGQEPGVCREPWVSEDECIEGGEGWRDCNSGVNKAQGRTRCVNTFRSYTCDCGSGSMRVTDKATGKESCAGVNQCLMSSAPATRADCTCDRCTCISLPGGFNCSGELPDYCTKAEDYGGCWRGEHGGKLYHACNDNMRMYRWLMQNGRLNNTVKPFRCQCPPCFRAGAAGGCEPACDLSHCDAQLGACLPGAPAAGRRADPGFFGIFFGMLGAAGASAGVTYALYHFHTRRRLEAEMRSILEEYVPLASPPLADPNDTGGAASASGGSSSRLSRASHDSGGAPGGGGAFGGGGGLPFPPAFPPTPRPAGAPPPPARQSAPS